ncbi:MAG: RnfABCDGE type electron transport complex subunit B [Spirochaetia bacterium]|nr:RnfABCDGE type electron transport complex subunit B [Spirochaetia bacterium]
MFNTILYAFISVSLLGAFFGLGLAIAARYLYVKKDQKLTDLEEALPGYNCGACGYAGCAAYAVAILNGEAEDIALCAAGGAESVQKIADIMDLTVDVSSEKKVAFVHCRGGKDTAKYAFEYNGITDCNAAYSMFQGNKVCKYGCLGLGSCIKVCPVDAISNDKDGLVVVDKEKCISCELCVKVCPSGVMKMIPYTADYVVACNSKDKGAVTRKACTVGCIGCKICEKKSPEGGFKVENFLSAIDYSANGERKNGADACPTKCIVSTDKIAKIILKKAV